MLMGELTIIIHTKAFDWWKYCVQLTVVSVLLLCAGVRTWRHFCTTCEPLLGLNLGP